MLHEIRVRRNICATNEKELNLNVNKIYAEEYVSVLLGRGGGGDEGE
jgi:hypothetical protein